MRDWRLSKLATLCAVVSLGAVGCAAETPDEVAPEFAADQGTPELYNPATDADYPAGPFGYEVGDIIPNYAFVGYPTYTGGTPGLYHPVYMADYYNPTGQGTFAVDSPYGPNKPKPVALNLVMSSGWCGPCQVEAADILPPKFELLAPAGHFTSILIDGYEGGVPADFEALDAWSDSFLPAFTQVIDPKSQVMPHYYPAYPGSLIIDTRTMQIVLVEVGQLPTATDPDQEFWDIFDEVIAGTYVIPSDPG